MPLPAVPISPDLASAGSTAAGASTPSDGSGVAVLLRRAEPLRTVYQPIVDLRSGAVAGYEALTRVVEWPARSPAPWFAAAGREGLGAAFEATALGSALRARPQLARGQFLAVNIAATALLHPDVTSALLGEDDLAGVVVAVSDVESADPAQLVAVLEGLRGHGLLVAVRVVDGGRAELCRLADLRPDLVELGGDLVRGVAEDEIAGHVVQLVLGVAADLGAEVLAAGIEALSDARWLQGAGVALGEGWLFGRARAGLLQPSPEIVAWLRSPDSRL